MEHSYYDIPNRATAHLIDLTQGRWLLTALEVGREKRGQGHAGRLLARVLEDADREGVALCLQVDPDGSLRSLDRATLQAFYERRGFVLIEEGAMVRPPYGAAVAVEDLRSSALARPL